MNVIVVFDATLENILMCKRTKEPYIELIEEVNKLEWVNINDNFFDMNRYAGEGNIGHIIEKIKIDLGETNK